MNSPITFESVPAFVLPSHKKTLIENHGKQTSFLIKVMTNEQIYQIKVSLIHTVIIDF